MHVAIISSRRPDNVLRMIAHCGSIVPTWYVGDGEGLAYEMAGAAKVVEAGGLVEARNLALADAAGGLCVQLSDDLRKLEWAEPDGDTMKPTPISLPAALQKMSEALAETEAHLAGVAPTPNAYWAKARIHTSAFIVGDMIAIRDTPLRFDPALRLKEDYDYTLQHLTEYGRVARLDQLLATFLHRKNRGGAVAYRTDVLEEESIAYLQSKWPGALRPNAKRPGEVLLRWKPPSES